MLTPERIMKLEQQSYVKGHRPVSTEDCWGDEKITYESTEHFNMFIFARTIETEVRKQDDVLIQQMLEALTLTERYLEIEVGVAYGRDAHISKIKEYETRLKKHKKCITAARKRLETHEIADE